MDYLLIIIIVLLIFICILLEQNKKMIPATSDDWIILFIDNKERNFMSIHFYPMIAFYRDIFDIRVITSTIIHFEANTKNEDIDLQLSYYRWARGNVLSTLSGSPENITFYETVYRAISDKKRIIYNGIPEKYEEMINRAKKEYLEQLSR